MRFVLVLVLTLISATGQVYPLTWSLHDGQPGPLFDPLLDKLQGNWQAKGLVAGHRKTVNVKACWDLQHRYMHIHEKDVKAEPGATDYEADVYIGLDPASGEYIVHWLDVYGGGFSRVVGFGSNIGESDTSNIITFTFQDYKDEVRNTWRYSPSLKIWSFLIEQRSYPNKEWKMFASQVLYRVVRKKWVLTTPGSTWRGR